MAEQKKLIARKKKKKAIQKSQSYKSQKKMDQHGAPKSMRIATGDRYNIG